MIMQSGRVDNQDGGKVQFSQEYYDGNVIGLLQLIQMELCLFLNKDATADVHRVYSLP